MEHALSKLSLLLQLSLSRVYEQLVANLPQMIYAFVIVIAGVLIGVVAYYLCRKILDFFAVDKLVAKTPLAHFLRELGLSQSVSRIFSLLIFWMIILVTLLIVSEYLHLQRVSSGLYTITGFIPQLIIALLIVVIGLLLARFLELLTIQWVTRLRIGYEHMIGKVVYIGVLVCVFISAFEQLGFSLSFFTTNVMTAIFVILAILAIGSMIAARVFLENAVACLQLRMLIEVGHEVEIGDIQGSIEAFTLTSVIIHRAEQNQVVVPASLFLKEKYTICWECDDKKGATKKRSKKSAVN